MTGCLNPPTNVNQQATQNVKTKTLADAEIEGLNSGIQCDTLLLGFTFSMDKSIYLKHANKLSRTGKIDLMGDESFVYYLLTSDYKCYTRVTPNFFQGKLSKLICNIMTAKSSKVSNSGTDIATSVRQVFEEKYGNTNGVNMFISTGSSGLTTYAWVCGKKKLTFTDAASFDMINIEYTDVAAERGIKSDNNVQVQKHKETAKSTKKDI